MPIVDAGFVPDEDLAADSRLVLHGPTIWIDIGFDPSFDPTAGTERPKPSVTGIPALVDSGAQESCIDKTLARELRLSAGDRRTISGSAGEHDADFFLCQFHCPHLQFTQWGLFAGVDLAGGGQIHRALIGRTFLNSFIMIYDGLRGQVTLAR